MPTTDSLSAIRLDAALAEMERAGIVGYDASPPYARLLRAAGLSSRPLHYLPLWQVALLMFTTFGLGVTLFGFLLSPGEEDGGAPFYAILTGTMIASGFFALIMTVWTYWTRKSAGLSRWEDLDAAAK